MKKILVFFFCLNAVISSAKEACYLADGLPADLFFIKMNKSKTVKRAITFKETTKDLSKEKRKKLQPWFTETLQPVHHAVPKNVVTEPTQSTDSKDLSNSQIINY